METYLALARAHAPRLFVVLPFLASALVGVANGQRIGWLIATAAALVGAALAVDLCWRTFSGNAAIYVAHEGLAIAANALGTFSIAILSFASCSIVIAVGAVLRIGSRAASFGLALILCAGGAWAGAALAQDFTTFFVFIEAAWLSCVGVVALLGRESRGALNGALRMLFDGGIASVLLLLGIGLMERGLGSTLIASITSERLSAPNTVSLGVALSVTALALMAGSAPLSAWAGAAYGRAGGVAALLIGAMGSAGALLALMHVAIAAMPAPAIGAGLGFALCVLGVMSATIGSAQAVGAKNI
jgi:formate hydrogenlyase subunit 3/multisubunit Na+/H+ antiporter MnhD subunit